MAIGSGIGASFGVVDESVYGTFVAPTRWPPGTSFFVKPTIETSPIEGIAAGRFADPDEVVVGRFGTGQWVGQVPTTKWGFFMKHLFGTTVTPTQQAATAAYLQSLTFADNFGKSFTAQSNVPLTTGTEVTYTGTGGKITAVEFSSEINTPLMATVDMWFQNVVDSQTKANPTIVANGVLNGGGSPTAPAFTVKLGSFGSESAITGIRSASVKIERAMDLTRPGVPGAYPEPIMNDKVKVSGTLTPDFQAKADFADRFLANTGGSLVLQWNGTLIASTYYNGLSVTCPKVRFRDAVPGIDGPDVVKGSVAFDAFYDATNGLVLGSYMSTDTTV